MNTRTILLVDDHADFLFMLSSLLERNGYNVLTAADGNEAFKVVRDASVDLLVTDILMPEQDGLGLMTKLKESKLNIPIIAMSGGVKINQGGYLNVAKVMGAKRIFEKPFDNADFLAAVREVAS